MLDIDEKMSIIEPIVNHGLPAPRGSGQEKRMQPTMQQIIDASGGKLSRDGTSVVVGYGSLGYYRLTPTTVIRDGAEIPAVEIRGRLTRRDGGNHTALRNKLRASNLDVR